VSTSQRTINKLRKQALALQLRAQGKSIRTIAEKMDEPRSTVHHWLKEALDEAREENRMEARDQLFMTVTTLQAIKEAAFPWAVGKVEEETFYDETTKNFVKRPLRYPPNWQAARIVMDVEKQILQTLGLDSAAKIEISDQYSSGTNVIETILRQMRENVSVELPPERPPELPEE
jgi:hypothetical protein